MTFANNWLDPETSLSFLPTEYLNTGPALSRPELSLFPKLKSLRRAKFWEFINFEDSAGREEDLVCLDIAEEPHAVGLEGDL